MSAHPQLIQGGMGAGVSDWRLARAVAQAGQLGVVSGTALDSILVRRLQLGDPDGHMRWAMGHFPDPDLVEATLARYFVEGGIPPDQPLAMLPMHRLDARRDLLALTVLANFVEVHLARAGHDGLVGINLLEKIQLPNLASLYGAMLAGVDYVLMGAGIPMEIPGVLDAFARHAPATLRIDVQGTANGQEHRAAFDPAWVLPPGRPDLRRPYFLPIVSSVTLARALRKRATGRIDGFVIEGHVAGGHNAPPRGETRLDAAGEPIYGERDAVDLAQFRRFDLPFWLAGAYGRPEQLAAARAEGAVGVQVGTPFAFCEESGLDEAYKRRVLERVRDDPPRVVTEARASPTGFPFKVVQLEGTLAATSEYAGRRRVCDLGYLRELYQCEDGTVGYRCPAEPVDAYVRKGGSTDATIARRCLCNGLLANIGLGQRRKDGNRELPILTSGSDLATLEPFLQGGRTSYTARDVVAYLVG